MTPKSGTRNALCHAKNVYRQLKAVQKGLSWLITYK